MGDTRAERDAGPTRRALTGRLTIGPVPLTCVVAAEVVLVALLVATAGVPSALRWAALGGALAVLPWVVPVHGVPAGSLLLARVVSSVSGRARTVPPGRVRTARTRSGEVLGVLERAGRLTAAVEVRVPEEGPLHVGSVPRVSLGALVQRARAAGLPLESATLLHDPVLAGPAQLLLVRTVSDEGAEAALVSLAGAAVAALREAGLDGTPVGPDRLGALVRAALDPAGDGRWAQRWAEVETGAGVRAVLRADRLGGRVRPDAALDAGADALALVVRPGQGPECLVRLLARVSTTAAGPRRRLERAVRADQGPRWLPENGRQAAAVREAGVLGADPPPGGRRDRAGWVPVDEDRLLALVPPASAGPLVGRSADGRPVRLGVSAGGGGLVVSVGDRAPGAALAGAVARQGWAVTVVSARPAPWRALARDVVGPVHVVGSLDGPPPPGLVVVEDPGAGWRLPTTLHGRPVLLLAGARSELADEVLRGARTVLTVAPGGGADDVRVDQGGRRAVVTLGGASAGR